MRSASRASQRFSRVLVLDKAIDALVEQHEQEEVLAAIEAKRYPAEAVEIAKTRLPPTDRGIKAYLFLLSAFIIEAIMWGEYDNCLFLYQISSVLLSLEFCFEGNGFVTGCIFSSGHWQVLQLQPHRVTEVMNRRN